ncbi:TonB-dependent receptor [Sphingobium subterraneum]|nr:TonB-dependent receptor [Sphingobium subterraneum]
MPPDDPQSHQSRADDIVITGVIQRDRLDTLGGTSVLSAQQLTRALRPTLGETLSRQPGVSSSSFGPNASRPILRGLQGERVRILSDGIGSFDVSNTSADHAVAINPLTAERIEILRGPAALLYGSSAIGGVVNVIDARIPVRVPKAPVSADALATYGSAANERSVSGKVEVPIGDRFVAHVDGSRSKTDDLRTGGHILSPALRTEAAASGDPDIASLATLKGDLPNSAAESWEVAGALAFIDSNGNLGVSVSHLDNLYGVPVRYSFDPAEPAEQVRLHMKQTRADLRGEIRTQGGFLDRIRLRAGFADYQHAELEEDGTVGTTFSAQGIESRLELVQAKRGGWEGASGVQYYARDFNVVGEEKFLPANITSQIGLFTLQSLDLGKVRLEGGARYEHARVRAKEDAGLGTPETRRKFDALSFSAGASVEIIPSWRIGINLAHSERAPSAEELYARGPHAGTQAFELGNPNFGIEKNNGIEATLRGRGTHYTLSLGAFYNRFSGFITDTRVPDAACEAVLDDEPLTLSCFQYAQSKARSWGIEAEGSATLIHGDRGSLNVDAGADYVRTTIVGSGPAPRIPPLRLMGGLDWTSARTTTRVEIEHSFAQNRITALETATPDYTLVNASFSIKPFANNDKVNLTLSANNIFDVTARRHASVLKDYAPLAGRDIRVTVRVGI